MTEKSPERSSSFDRLLLFALLFARMSASAGLKWSIDNLIYFFEGGLLDHGDLAGTLQAFYMARAEMKSNDRDAYIEHLKKIGKYDKKLDL